jgi:hypothetical protein
MYDPGSVPVGEAVQVPVECGLFLVEQRELAGDRLAQPADPNPEEAYPTPFKRDTPPHEVEGERLD